MKWRRGCLHGKAHLLGDRSGCQPPHDLTRNDATIPTTFLAQRCHPPKLDGLNRLGCMSPLAINSATLKSECVSLVLSSNARRWLLVMPEGPPAAPLRAERTLRQNTLSSKLKMGPSTGRVAVLPSAKSAPANAWRPADNSPTWITFNALAAGFSIVLGHPCPGETLLQSNSERSPEKSWN